MMNVLPKLSFVLGGASSGKSAYAEKLAHSHGLSKHYIATAHVLDAEMEEKVALHRQARTSDWTLHEAPFDLDEVLAELTAKDVALIDCMTMWLSNHMMEKDDVHQTIESLLAAISNTPARVVIVSNEVGHGIVPDNNLARRFRLAQGKLNIALAEQADLAVFVVAGLPQVLKGELF